MVVVRRKRAAGTITSPLLLRIPALGLEREIFDDAMVQPACETQSDVRTNALFVYCRGMDGAVKLRVHQRANTLVLEVASAGDAPALTQGETIELPPGRIVQFRTRPPTEQRNNPGVGVVLESR